MNLSTERLPCTVGGSHSSSRALNELVFQHFYNLSGKRMRGGEDITSLLWSLLLSLSSIIS